MSEKAFRMFELHSQGFTCGQILLIMGLDIKDSENADLVRAAHGLAGGVGFSGSVCGALTGGVLLLSLFLGKGTAQEHPHDEFYDLAEELVRWFEEEYGGVNCRDILGGAPNPGSFDAKCGEIVSQVYERVEEMLEQVGEIPDG